MTLRGDSPPNASLSEWIEQSARLVDGVIKTANVHRLNIAGLKVRLDGRDTNVEVVLATIQHHMNEEYPYLLRHTTRNSMNAIHASNLNDVYRVSALIDLAALQDTSLNQSLTRLKAHLENIPPQNSQ